jgi:hypothetical protein
MNTWLKGSLVVVVGALACGDGTGPGVSGTFEAVVSGSYSGEMSGEAEFGIFAGEGFGLSMHGGAGQLFGIGHRTEARPAVGTYEVGDPEEEGIFFALYVRSTPEGVATLVSTEGELEITHSTATRLEGSFAIHARGTVAGDPFEEREVLVEGVFNASCARNARCE